MAVIVTINLLSSEWTSMIPNATAVQDIDRPSLNGLPA